MLVQGSPVPDSQPKSEVQLRVVKQGSQMPIGSCTTTLDVPAGSYVFALWAGQSPTPPNYMIESNRCAVVIFPDGTKTTDCPSSVPTGIKPPTNFRFP
jgi:hypothetical protein